MQVKEQHQVTIGDTTYLLTALDAIYGLEVMGKLMNMEINKEPPSPDFMKKLVIVSASVGGKKMDDSMFNIHFSRKYKELYNLFEEIIKFNFGDQEDPNAEGDTSEQ